MSDIDLVPITYPLLDAGRSARGGWSADQLSLIGVSWPPPAGWKTASLGRLISSADAKRFVDLRDDGPPARDGNLFEPG